MERKEPEVEPEYKSMEERFNEMQAQKRKTPESKKKNVFVSILTIVIGAIIIGIVSNSVYNAYKEEVGMDEVDIEKEIERLELEIQQMTSNPESFDVGSVGVYDDIFSELSWGQFVNQKYTDKWDMEITNNGGNYIVGSLNIELYDENNTYINTVSAYLPSGGLPPYQSFVYKGYMKENEKEKIVRLKVKPDWLSYD